MRGAEVHRRQLEERRTGDTRRGTGARRGPRSAQALPGPNPRRRKHGVRQTLRTPHGRRAVRQASQGATDEPDRLAPHSSKPRTQRAQGRPSATAAGRPVRTAARVPSERHLVDVLSRSRRGLQRWATRSDSLSVDASTAATAFLECRPASSSRRQSSGAPSSKAAPLTAPKAHTGFRQRGKEGRDTVALCGACRRKTKIPRCVSARVEVTPRCRRTRVYHGIESRHQRRFSPGKSETRYTWDRRHSVKRGGTVEKLRTRGQRTFRDKHSAGEPAAATRRSGEPDCSWRVSRRGLLLSSAADVSAQQKNAASRGYDCRRKAARRRA